MSIKDLKVGWEHVGPTMTGAKEFTFRFDDEKHIGRGDALRLTDPDGNPFAMAKVVGTLRMTPQEFIFLRLPYYEDISMDELLEMMNEYYPEATIRRDTECKLIRYDISAIMGDYNHGTE